MTAAEEIAAAGGPDAPALSVRRLLLVVTGTPAAHSVPQWVNWARMAYPELEVRILLTRSALRFVTPVTMQLRTRAVSVDVDSWEEVDTSLHVELARWAEAAVVYPATAGYLARLAHGMTDAPSLLALQTTSGVVALAPSLPPGGAASAAVARSWATLAAQDDVVLVPPEPGLSLHTGGLDGHVPPPLSDVLGRLEERLAERTRSALPEPEEAGRRTMRTGLLATLVADREGGCADWVRSTGPASPEPFGTPSPELEEWLRDRDAGPTRWAVGTGDRTSRTYRAAGPVAVAGELLRSGPSASLVPLVRSLGERLAELHGLDGTGPLGTGLRQGSRGLRRLSTWLRGRAADPAAALAEARLRGELGTTLLGELRDLTEELAAPVGTIAHGGASLGALVPAPGAAQATMLVGEDVCLGPPELDLAWLTGELIELRWSHGGDDDTWQHLLDALVEGYGRDLGQRWGRLAALRVALHLHDYTAYVSPDPARTARYPAFIRFLAEQG